MTAWAADRRLIAPALAAAALLALAAPAWSQGAPVQLAPRREAAPPAVPPAPTAPQTVPPAPGRPATQPAPPGTPAGIQVEQLRPIDANAAGTLDAAQGGLGIEAWTGSRMALVSRLVPMLPATTPSHALRGLMRRTLLTRAPAPDGDAAGPSFLELRAARLMAMGDVAGVAGLTEALPDSAATPALRRLRLDALLLQQKFDKACAELPPALAAEPAEPHWARLQVICQIRERKTREAGLGLDLLREHDQADDAFQAAVEALMGAPTGSVKALPRPTPLHLAALRAAQLQLPPDAVSTAAPALLAAIADGPNATMDLRLAAGEKAELVGALDGEVLRLLYANTQATERELANPGALADKGPRGRAVAFRAAQSADPAGRAELIGRALTQARSRGQYFQTARVYAPLLAEIRPAPELADFAPTAIRALFAAGAYDAARAWAPLARGKDGGEAALWPLFRLIGADDRPLAPEQLLSWQKSRGGLTAELQGRRAAVVYSVLAALGDDLPDEAWLPLIDEPALVQATVPRPALWQALYSATEKQRRGETALLGLLSLGEDGAAGAEPANLYRVLAGLRLVGLEAEARDLAVEAMLAAGI